MNCPNCGQPVDQGAAFCGNCGFTLATTAAAVAATPQPPVAMQPMQPAPVAQPAYAPATPAAPQPPTAPIPAMPELPPTPPVAQYGVPVMTAAGPAMPAYALAPAAGHHDTKAILALVFGIVGLLGTFLTAFAGLLFGVAGIVLATLSWRRPKRGLVIGGLLLSIAALLLGIGTVAYNVNRINNTKQAGSSRNRALNSAATNQSSTLSTSCYSLKLAQKETIQNASGSCDANIFNGPSLDTSSDVYRILVDAIPNLNSTNFTSISEQSLAKDINDNFPTAVLAQPTTNDFAGSPGVQITATDKGDAIEESTVLHAGNGGNNFFVIVHLVSGSTVDLKGLEGNWQWK